jgi:hypothetical protein
MLAPTPLPVFTLSPDIDELTPGQERLLETTLESLAGRVCGVLVAAARMTDTHEVLELETAYGPVMVVERTAPVGLPD